jgi:hypothetical protein
MPRVGFEFTTPVFKRAKTVHASDRAATVISPVKYLYLPTYNNHAQSFSNFFAYMSKRFEERVKI